MINDRELMQMALDALTHYINVVTSDNDPERWAVLVDGGGPARTAILALRERLEHPNSNRVSLTGYAGFTIDLQDDKGWFIGEMDLIKWLIKNRSEDYFNSDFYKEKCEREKDIGVTK